jgi:acetylcholinesterase
MCARLSATLVEGGGSTTAQLGQYLNSFMLPTAKQNEIDLLLRYYPDDVTAGSPFDTGHLNALSRPSFSSLIDPS